MKLSKKTQKILKSQLRTSTRFHPHLFLWLSLWKQCEISTTLTKLRWFLASYNQSWTKTDQQRTLPSNRSLFCANLTRNHFPMTLSKNFAGKRIQTSKSLALKDKCLRCLSTNFIWSTLICSYLTTFVEESSRSYFLESEWWESTIGAELDVWRNQLCPCANLMVVRVMEVPTGFQDKLVVVDF